MARTIISIPDQLHKRMDAVTSVNWSQVAVAAFQERLDRIDQGGDTDRLAPQLLFDDGASAVYRLDDGRLIVGYDELDKPVIENINLGLPRQDDPDTVKG